VGAEAALFESAYKAAGIVGVLFVALALAVVALWRRGLNKDRELEIARLSEVLQLKSDLQTTSQRLETCHQARLTDREAQTKQVIEELHAQRDALEAAAGSGRDQAEALDALAKQIGELRADLKDQGKDLAALRATKGGGR
jgi:DNA repair exonuclease SbcCD ATPase subunit